MLGVVGQSSIRLNNYLENLYTINPGYIDNKADLTFSMAARKQWMGFPGAPTTFYATGTKFLQPLDTQLGIRLLNDKIGFTNIFNASFSYGYNIHLNPKWQLDLGIAASYQNLSYNLSELDAETMNNPAVYMRLLTTNNVNFDLGAHLTNNTWSAGISSQNIFSLFFSEDKLQANTNYIYAKYRKETDNTVDFQGGITGIQYEKMIQLEFNFTAYLKQYMKPDLLQIGAFYRTRSEIGAIVGINLNPSLHLWYSFDWSVNGISRNSVGTQELMLIYRLDNQQPRNKD
jgi:type IX secretion system PorP/SprF family membrane protein